MMDDRFYSFHGATMAASSTSFPLDLNNAYGDAMLSYPMPSSSSLLPPLPPLHLPSVQDASSSPSISVPPFNSLLFIKTGLHDLAISAPTACKEVSTSHGGFPDYRCSKLAVGSRYAPIVREILAQISDGCHHHNAVLSGYCGEEEDDDGSMGNVALPKEEAIAQMLTLLKLVDEEYRRCMGEMERVARGLKEATEVDGGVHMAVRRVAWEFKKVRGRMSRRLARMEEEEEVDRSSFLENCGQGQRKMMMGKKEGQIWRPQRGLPEKAVSVLRTWMFQNFLHPYPKDAEKHVLAVKSGLTRSQVSNWFINARVRLWKPMIEEMYAELNRRKVVQQRMEEEVVVAEEKFMNTDSQPRFLLHQN